MVEILMSIQALGLLPVIALEDAGDAAPLADALVQGGMPVAEITFRTAAAAESIKQMAKEHPEMLVGAGTVLNVDQLQQAVDAGAKFIVTPGFNPKVVAKAIEMKIPITPGVVTPTEVEMAIEHGLKVVKFFPAQAMGGLATLKAISAPYGAMRFIPTGGIDARNLADYLQFNKVLACGGSWMVHPDLLKAKDFQRIASLTKDAMAIVRSVRPSLGS